MSGKAILFTHINFLICNPITGCIMREEVFQPNWISVWSQLQPVGKASHRLQGVVSCLLFLCPGNGNWLFPFEELISASHLQSSLLPVSQRQQRYSWQGGGFFPQQVPQENKAILFLLTLPFPFSAPDAGSPLSPHLSTGGADAQTAVGPW